MNILPILVTLQITYNFIGCVLFCEVFDANARDRCHCGRHTERTEQRKKRWNRNMTSLYFYIKDKKEKQDVRRSKI